MNATVISVQVGVPRTVLLEGREVSTGIFKHPVQGRVRMHALDLEGDQQADLTVHGGPDKAVYAYPSEHYPFWKGELPGVELPWGAIGENSDDRQACWKMRKKCALAYRFAIGSAHAESGGNAAAPAVLQTQS